MLYENRVYIFLANSEKLDYRAKDRRFALTMVKMNTS